MVPTPWIYRHTYLCYLRQKPKPNQYAEQTVDAESAAVREFEQDASETPASLV